MNKKLKILRVAGLSIALILVVAVTQISAQKKTNSTSPCVELAASGKNDIARTWANQDFPPCKQAIAALRSASVIVLGEDVDSYPSPDYHLQEWLMKIGQNAAWKAKFDDGFKFTDAVEWLKESELSSRGDSWLRAFVNGIFDEVHGRLAADNEAAAYVPQIKARKDWYATILLKEKQRLNQSSTLREAMINNSYLAAFGRPAKPDETAYWKPRKDIHREIIAADRQYLYAPNNAAILREVVVRRFTDKKNGRPPSAETVAAKIKEFTAKRRVYNEMY